MPKRLTRLQSQMSVYVDVGVDENLSHFYSLVYSSFRCSYERLTLSSNIQYKINIILLKADKTVVLNSITVYIVRVQCFVLIDMMHRQGIED